MPPFKVNRPIWHGVDRQVIVREDTTITGKRYAVVVTFTRVGYSNETQQPIREPLPEHVVATKLGPHQADDLRRTIASLCDDTYAQGYSDGRKRA